MQLQKLRIDEQEKIYLDDFEIKNVKEYILKSSTDEPAELTIKLSVALDGKNTKSSKSNTKKLSPECKFKRYEGTYKRLQAETYVLLENLIVENRLLTETINYIFQNHLLSNEQIEEIKGLIGERCIRQSVDGTYCW